MKVSFILAMRHNKKIPWEMILTITTKAWVVQHIWLAEHEFTPKISQAWVLS